MGSRSLELPHRSRHWLIPAGLLQFEVAAHVAPGTDVSWALDVSSWYACRTIGCRQLALAAEVQTMSRHSPTPAGLVQFEVGTHVTTELTKFEVIARVVPLADASAALAG
jgi:hypothetical protein